MPCPDCSPAVLQRRTAERINRTGIGAIPEYARGWDWASLIEQISDHGGDLSAVDAVQEFTSMAVRAATGDRDAAAGQKRGLYLFGEFGLGKTSMAICAMRDAIAAGLDAAFISTIDFFDGLRDCYAANQGALASEITRMAHTTAFLVLDDIGTEKPTGWVLQETYRLLERRFATAGLFTVITGNMSPKALDKQWLADGASAVDTLNVGRVVQRLGRHCTLINVHGANLSLKPRASRADGPEGQE